MAMIFVHRNYPWQDCLISIGKMNALFIAIVALLTVLVTNTGVTASPADSTKATLLINPRLHSSGYFPFTGALLNRDPVFDINIFYEKKMFGFFVFQSIDLVDRHSYVNYLQPGIFATFKLDPKFRVRAFFGYIFSQAQSFKDPDSDYYAATSFYWDLSKHLRFENTLLYYDYNIQDKIANRFLVGWTSAKLKADFFLWYRKVFAENQGAVSASIALTYPIAKLSNRTTIQLTGAYMWYVTDYKPSFALNDGFIFTVAVPVNVLP